MIKFFTRFFVPAVALLILLAVSFLYYHHIKEQKIAVMHQKGTMRNINESVYDLVRIRGDKVFNDSCALYLQRYVANYDKQGLRVTVVSALNGNVLFDTSFPDTDVAENHSGRPEVIQAIETGFGYDIRRLSTVHNEEYFYVATFHSEYDFIVRSSLPYKLAMNSDRTSGLVLIIVVGVIIALVLYILYRIMVLAGSSELATQKLQQHLRIAQEGIAIFDSKRRLLFANMLFREYADIISSKNLPKVEDILDQPEFRGVKRFVDNYGYLNNETRETHISQQVEVAGRIFVIRGVLFQDKGFEISINDVTATEEQTRLKRQLTQNAAHEFKTPVCSIQGYLETIIQNYPHNLSEEQMLHFLKRCYSQSNRLNSLVQDMSQLNEMTTASQRIKKEMLDLSLLVRNMLAEVSNKVQEQGMTVIDELPATLFINADSSMIYSIFRNLVDNAISYAGEGTTVRITCFRSDEQFYYFSFSDNGCGVPEEHLPRIFERFYRVDKGRSRKLGGTGLGLAIVRNAVVLHGGTISARVAQGGGLEFVFKLQR